MLKCGFYACCSVWFPMHVALRVFNYLSSLEKQKFSKNFELYTSLFLYLLVTRYHHHICVKYLNPGTKKKSRLCWELSLDLDSSSQLQQWKGLFANRTITDEDRLQCYPFCPLSVVLHYSIWPMTIMVRCSTNHRKEHIKPFQHFSNCPIEIIYTGSFYQDPWTTLEREDNSRNSAVSFSLVV